MGRGRISGPAGLTLNKGGGVLLRTPVYRFVAGHPRRGVAEIDPDYAESEALLWNQNEFLVRIKTVES